MNDNVFTLREASKAGSGKTIEADVQRVQFNNWQRDVLQELKGINTNLQLLNKRTEYGLLLLGAGLMIAFFIPWINSL